MLSAILLSVNMENIDKNKFENIYYTYKNVLFYCAIRILKNESDAEDVLQEAFVKIAKNIKLIDSIKNKETLAFLIVITKNTAYDYLRKNQKQIACSLEEVGEISTDENIIEDIIDKLEYEKIVEAVKSVPAPYSEVLFLHYVKDLSVGRTATLLNRKKSTVKMQLVRGKRILGEKLWEVGQ